MTVRFTLLLPSILLLACGESNGPGPTPADPGYVELTLHAPDGETGALRISVTGPGIDSVMTPGLLSFSSRVADHRLSALVLGDMEPGVIGRVWMPDRHLLADYRVLVEEAVTRTYAQRAPALYAITLQRE